MSMSLSELVLKIPTLSSLESESKISITSTGVTWTALKGTGLTRTGKRRRRTTSSSSLGTQILWTPDHSLSRQKGSDTLMRTISPNLKSNIETHGSHTSTHSVGSNCPAMYLDNTGSLERTAGPTSSNKVSR